MKNNFNDNIVGNIAKIAYILVFFLICAIPVLTMPFVDWSQDSDGENRDKAEFPEIIVDESLNMEFFQDMDDYLNDNFQFREDLITINATYKEAVLNTSAESQVIIGENDWLYYTETLDDYTRLDVLSDSEITDIVKVISLVEEYTESVGCEFVFTIAANKSSIYSENMPLNYQSLDVSSNAMNIEEELEEAGLGDIYADMFDTMMNAEELAYLTRDSHWNNYGAYLGFLEMCSTLDIETQNFTIIGEETRTDYESDLDGMLYASGGQDDAQIYYEFDSTYEFESNFKTVEDLQILTSCATGDGSIVVFRDSFGNSLLDYFALQFESVEFRRVVPYDVDLAADVDYMIIEIVERNIPDLLETAPVMPAIVRDDYIEGNFTEVNSDNITVEEDGDYLHIFGTYDGEDISMEATYIEVVTENNDTVYYEAFPIIEDDLELEDTDNLNGFSAYIPMDAFGGNYELNIYCK